MLEVEKKFDEAKKYSEDAYETTMVAIKELEKIAKSLEEINKLIQ